MKRYLILLLSGSLLAQQAAWARPPKMAPQRDRVVWSQIQRKANCDEGRSCRDNRRLQALQLREAARNGDVGADPARRRLLPPPDGHPQTIPSKPNFWQDRHRQELEEKPSE
ncbi:hypothetical protein [Chromobacterium alticapitis]|uniref:Uncharacterized protein n=1 Tax=Chromobacterium alticapitis TaxID=2073169 RepID=A0A2S5DK74_9NEIS|nr:hypothetical protein [Chromobacterium alticapitis]POZ63483.1 hypothetical protein C2I19_02280 [Chromobacterium alticapitis]